MKVYSGVEGFAFVSYSHVDTDRVIYILEKLALAGTRIWYDEGIAPAANYLDVIAGKIEGCALLIAFISKSSLDSQYCLDEIRFAYEKKKPIMVIKLDNTELPASLQMILNRYQFHNLNEASNADETLRELLPSIPSQVVEQKGTRIFSDARFVYYLQSTLVYIGGHPYGNTGYKIVAFSKVLGKEYILLTKQLPYGSEYEIYYAMDSKHSPHLEFALNVTWDFTFVRQMPDDDYFMTRFVYEITSKSEDEPPILKEKTVYRESYTTGEKIFYNFVEDQGTYVDRLGNKTVGYANPSDPLRLRYSKKEF